MTHTVVRYKVFRDNTGIYEEIPVILTEFGCLEPLIEYIMKIKFVTSERSINKLVQAVGLLIDYMQANSEAFDTPRDLFETFVTRLYSGTVDANGDDPSDLYWGERQPSDVAVLVKTLSKFFDWMPDKYGTQHPNPWRQATRAEQQLAWAAWQYKRNNSFFKHLKIYDLAKVEMSRARSVLLQKTPVVTHAAEVKFFPEEHIYDLLFKGFIVPGKQKSPMIAERLNLRDILITLLMHYGALRVSEPFHLFIHDVIHDDTEPGTALVKVYHPSLGKAPPDLRDAKGKPEDVQRNTYLRKKFRLLPRDKYKSTDFMHAGWKDNALDDGTDKFIEVQWSDAWAGQLFWKLWPFYVVQRSMLKPDHPFAFVTQEGKPYSIEAYRKAHAAALKRIGLESHKMLGTTPHGHRHAYGQRLADRGVSPEVIMRTMHHKSIESQRVYTEASRARVARELAAGMKRAESSDELASSSPDLLVYGFKDFDQFDLKPKIPKLLRRKK